MVVEAMIVDTETACIKDPVPVEVAYLYFDVPPRDARLGTALDVFHQRYNPNRDMDFGAVAAHNIIPSDLEDCPLWLGPPEVPEYVVGHNVDFDLEVLFGTKEKIPTNIRRICTLALSRWAYPDLDSHKLAAMMYAVFGQNDHTRALVRQSHGALPDVLMCQRLMHFIAEHFTVNSWEELWKMSEVARIPTRMSFGKYGPKDGQPGTLISEMAKDKGYVKWLLNLDDLDPYLRRAIEQ